MDLALVELERPDSQRLWHPFPWDISNGFDPNWWSSAVPKGSRSIFLQALEGDVEVARVRLDPPVEPPGIFMGVGNLGPYVYEIQFFQVRAGLNSKGQGSDVIALLEQRYPGHRFIARSRGADRFWGGRTLQWSRHLHSDPDKRKFGDPLYVSPAR